MSIDVIPKGIRPTYIPVALRRPRFGTDLTESYLEQRREDYAAANRPYNQFASAWREAKDEAGQRAALAQIKALPLGSRHEAMRDVLLTPGPLAGVQQDLPALFDYLPPSKRGIYLIQAKERAQPVSRPISDALKLKLPKPAQQALVALSHPSLDKDFVAGEQTGSFPDFQRALQKIAEAGERLVPVDAHTVRSAHAEPLMALIKSIPILPVAYRGDAFKGVMLLTHSTIGFGRLLARQFDAITPSQRGRLYVMAQDRGMFAADGSLESLHRRLPEPVVTALEILQDSQFDIPYNVDQAPPKAPIPPALAHFMPFEPPPVSRHA